MIDILWESQMLTMFAIDVTVGCKEITNRNRRLKIIRGFEPTSPISP